MFGREEENSPVVGGNPSANASILGAGSHFSGNVEVQGNLRIDGEFEGDVRCREMLEVGKTGILKGTLTVKNASISGRVLGNIAATERIELKAGSHLEGDIVTKRLVIDEGVFFEGNCRMGEKRSQARGPMAEVRKDQPSPSELVTP